MFRVVDQALLDELLAQAHQSPRKRSHLAFHADFEAPVQRMVIGLAAGTYVRPHMHPQTNKWEMLFLVRGSVLLLMFDPQGVVTERIIFSANNQTCGIEMAPGTWHTILPLEGDAAILEVKQGPYDPADVTAFADWAPAEQDAESDDFLRWAELAQVGDKYSAS
ncbi:WbuC family cupin fold metalloprotein [Photobacterium sp. TY1-4]|uniref:WbuC family cupin fold metalloprotein n=1 Tax=Photobacterium sp. TY1-4 TaxID=2899122 RepID=UPI0021C0275E|nr:WbuC family cupin fold metalloprotein [Photobacterium sp. TY1-4]UXI03402.1 WbuC family cupin fold metalloprotein [Photobacterium sp. TY1-4]